MGTLHIDERAPTRNWLATGALMGLIAGLVFALFEMIASAAGGASFFAPLRLISSLVLGREALGPEVALGTAIAVGTLVHVVLSSLYGAIFGLIERYTPAFHDRKGGIVLWATLFGTGLWLVNFYVFAQYLWPWFLETNPLVQWIAHAFFYGTVLGGLTALRTTILASQGPGEPLWPDVR